MSLPIKILIIGDDPVVSEKIATQLSLPEYEVGGILAGREEVFQQFKWNKPDIILMVIQLKGTAEVIEMAGEIKKRTAIPIIYMIADINKDVFNRAMNTRPAAFISKPFKKIDIQRAIELAIFNTSQGEFKTGYGLEECEPVILNDRIFVRCRDKMVKIMVADILYIEADRNYSRIFTQRKEFLLSTTLKAIEERLPKELFIRIHRSYIINISLIDEVGECYVLIMDKTIPLSAALREQLLKHLQTF